MLHIQNIGESKSILNRLLILRSYTQELELSFSSRAKDVLELCENLSRLSQACDEFHVSDGGTTFRFLISRLSREKGVYKVYASKRLLSRPHEPLFKALEQLGCKLAILEDHVLIDSSGWVIPKGKIFINCELSTQFLSALLLNCIGIREEIKIQALDLSNSYSYFEMTLEILKRSGINFNFNDDVITISPNQKITSYLDTEIDLSSTFSMVSCLLQDSDVLVHDFPLSSIQADFSFVEILKKLGIKNKRIGNGLKFFQGKLSAVDVSLRNCPDLLPVMSIMCAKAQGISFLRDVSHAKVKESDRVSKSMELLKLINIKSEFIEGDLIIYGGDPNLEESFSFNTDHDHRMAMACGVLMKSGVSVELDNAQVVNKSCPEFWDRIGVEF